jgi:RHS repeat-associated protein
VGTPDGSFERYHYDHEGQRVWAVNDTGGDAGTRYWFGESETFVPAAAPNTKRRYLYVSDGGGVLARAERVNNGVPNVELMYSDALQNLMLTTGVSGPASAPKVSVMSWFHYGAFGEVLAQGGDTNHRREFNFKENDVTSGLRYYGARYYDPMLMRWNSADPLYRFAPDAKLEEPQRSNLYAFSLNDPLSLLDPDGKDPVFTLWARRFAPFDVFGGGMKGDGDNRGMTTSKDVSSRTYMAVQVDMNSGTVSYTAGASSSQAKSGLWHVVFGDREMTANVTGEVRILDFYKGKNGTTMEVEMTMAGNMPLLSSSPDIDTTLDLRFTWTGSDDKMKITGDISGDNFPNLEIFVEGFDGARRMIGGFLTSHSKLLGPNTLYGEDGPLGRVHQTLFMDKKGRICDERRCYDKLEQDASNGPEAARSSASQ